MCWDSTLICQLESQTGYGVTCQVHCHLKVSLYEENKKTFKKQFCLEYHYMRFFIKINATPKMVSDDI